MAACLTTGAIDRLKSRGLNEAATGTALFITSRTVVCIQLIERAVTCRIRRLNEELCAWRVGRACSRVRRLVLHFCTFVAEGTSTVRNQSPSHTAVIRKPRVVSRTAVRTSNIAGCDVMCTREARTERAEDGGAVRSDATGSGAA